MTGQGSEKRASTGDTPCASMGVSRSLHVGRTYTWTYGLISLEFTLHGRTTVQTELRKRPLAPSWDLGFLLVKKEKTMISFADRSRESAVTC